MFSFFFAYLVLQCKVFAYSIDCHSDNWVYDGRGKTCTIQNFQIGDELKESYSDVGRIIFEDSRISQLPVNFFNKMDDVKIVEVSNVQLTELLRNSFEGLSKLTSADFSNNHLKFLPAEVISPTTQITEINLSNNEIEMIDTDAFKNLRLSSVDLSQNRLHYVNHWTFNQLTSLNSLNLSRNSLKIHFGMFPQGLMSLDLSYNNIENFSLKYISSLQNLQKLFISGNEMNADRSYIFPDFIFRKMPNLRNIEMGQNSVSCQNLFKIIIYFRIYYSGKLAVPDHQAVYNRSNIDGIECQE